MLKIRKEFKKFIKSNKLLTISAIISIIFITVYQYTKDLPEYIQHMGPIYDIMNNLTLAYVGSFIFYILQVYIPERKNNIKINSFIKNKIVTIEHNMIYPLLLVCKKEKINWDSEKIIYDDYIEDNCFKLTAENTDLLDFSFEKDMLHNQNNTYLKIIFNYIEHLQNNINKMYTYAPYLDIKLIEILNEIENSEYHDFFSLIKEHKNEILERFKGKLELSEERSKEYYNLYKKLKKYRIQELY